MSQNMKQLLTFTLNNLFPEEKEEAMKRCIELLNKNEGKPEAIIFQEIWNEIFYDLNGF